MSRKPAPPKPEELIAKLDVKFETFKEEINQLIAEKNIEIQRMNEKDSEIRLKIEENHNKGNEKLESEKNKLEKLLEDKLEQIKSDLTRSVEELSVKIQAASSSSSGTETRIQDLVERIENIQEKMYDFEVNKRNNLLFYGVKEDRRETPNDLFSKIRSVLRDSFSLKRDITISSASRMFSGPDVGGCRPVVVTFEEFKDRDEVLRKAGLLRGSSIHVTEDMSRRVRESRQELRRFMRDVRRSNPASVCSLQYDTLYVDKKCYKYNPIEGRVVEQATTAAVRSEGFQHISHPFYSRTLLWTGEDQLLEDLRLILDPGWDWQPLVRGNLQCCTGIMKAVLVLYDISSINRTQSCLIGGLGEDQSEVVAEMDEKIKELKSVVTNKDAELEKLKETVRLLQEKLDNNDSLNPVQSNVNPDFVNGQGEVLEEVDDSN